MKPENESLQQLKDWFYNIDFPQGISINQQFLASSARSEYLTNVPRVNINLQSTGSPSISPPNPLRSPLPHPQIQRILDQFVPRLVSGGINDLNHFKRRKRYRK